MSVCVGACVCVRIYGNTQRPAKLLVYRPIRNNRGKSVDTVRCV